MSKIDVVAHFLYGHSKLRNCLTVGIVSFVAYFVICMPMVCVFIPFGFSFDWALSVSIGGAIGCSLANAFFAMF